MYYAKVPNETDIWTLVLIKQKCPMKQTYGHLCLLNKSAQRKRQMDTSSIV